MQMVLGKTLWLIGAAVFGTAVANAGNITFTCAANIDTTQAGTCGYLNSTVANAYNSTFTDATANIYIQYGSAGLAQTNTYLNAVPYADYLAALQANPNKDALQVSSLASLTNATTPYGSGNVGITVALAQALGIGADALNGGLTGIKANGTSCNYGTANCYNAVITLTNASDTWYYDNVGGSPTGLYDIYSAVEHETDEVLGTSSCISTGSSTGKLTDPCDFFGGTGTPSAVDLYRYNSAGSLAVNANYIGTTGATAGAYFSWNGGTSNGANGFVYNTQKNGNDYADFLANCPAGPLSIQDAQGCPGQEAGQTILNDGGAEINILNAVGYDLAAPEPGTMLMFGVGLTAIGLLKRRRRV
jgi:hypothetical protein